MDPWSFLGTVTATGLGGFDPAPALIGAAALGYRIPPRHVVGFGVLLVVGTAACGMGLTAVVGTQFIGTDWHGLVRGGATAAWIELGLGLGVLGYAIHRLRPRPTGGHAPGHRTLSVTGLYLTALGFIGIVIFDLPFEILVAAAAGQPRWQAGIGWIIWAGLSQFPLVLLTGAAAAGRHAPLVRLITAARERLGPATHLLLGVVLSLVGLFLAVDALRFLALGRFLVS